jgi:hypothetical protein
MHSHLGVDSIPGLAATDDGNEMTDPTTPFVSMPGSWTPSITLN